VREKIGALSVLPFLLVFLAACGGSSHSAMSNEVPLIVSISDQPSSVGVLSFDIQITGACLLTTANAMATSCSGAQNLLPEAPMTVQLAGMQTPQQSDVLATTNVQADTYTAVLITFGTATAAVNVSPNSTDKDTATPPNSCTAGVTPTICELSPQLTSSSITLPFTGAATLSAGQPTSVSIELSVANSLVGTTAGRTTTFTLSPILTVSLGAGSGANGNLTDVSNVTGPVTDVETGAFTMTDSATAQSVTIATLGGTTKFNGFTDCGSSNLACVQSGQIVSVNYSVSDTSPIVLTATSVTNNVGFQSGQTFQGTIVATAPVPKVVVTSVAAGNTQDVTVGEVLTLEPPATSAGFSIAVPDGQTLPPSVSFASQGDLLAGQNVLIDSTGVAGNVATADQIALQPTQFSGTVSSIAAPSVTVNGLNAFFTGNGISAVDFQTGTQTAFGGTITGFSGMVVGDQANFDGFLFNGGAGQNPIVFGENIFDDGASAAAKRIK
jgi:hypothetical protein